MTETDVTLLLPTTHQLRIWRKKGFSSPWTETSRAKEWTTAKFYPRAIGNQLFTSFLLFSSKWHFTKYHSYPLTLQKYSQKLRNFFPSQKIHNSPFSNTVDSRFTPHITEPNKSGANTLQQHTVSLQDQWGEEQEEPNLSAPLMYQLAR